MLTLGERVLLLVHCGDHPVADCPQCGDLMRFDKLGVDIASGRCDYCPVCQFDLTTPLRRHLAECTWIRVQVREAHTRAWVLLDEARQAGKVSQERRDWADVLAREAEAERARSRTVKRGQGPDAAKTANADNMQPAAADLIRAKLLIGQLPRRTATKTATSVGSGLPCDGCDVPIIAGDLQHEVDAIGLGTLHFHGRCMQLWEEASAVPRDIAGGSDALALRRAELLVQFTGASGTPDIPTVLIPREIFVTNRHFHHPAALSTTVRAGWMHQGRRTALAAAAAVVAIVTAGLLWAWPTTQVRRHEVSKEHTVTRAIASQTRLVELAPRDETSRQFTPKTPQPRVAARKSLRPARATEVTASTSIESRVSLPAVATKTSTFAIAQALHQAP